MIDDVYTWQYRKRGLTTTPREIQFSLSQLNYSYVLLKSGSIQETTGSEFLNKFLPQDSEPLQYCYFVSMYFCDCVIDSDRIRIPVRIPVTSIKLLDRSVEFPISDREISVQRQCRLPGRQRGRLSWRVVTEQFNDTWLHALGCQAGFIKLPSMKWKFWTWHYWEPIDSPTLCWMWEKWTGEPTRLDS